jgi:hypothetical protein
MLLAGVSTPFISREALTYKWLLTLFYSLTAIILLRFALDMLKGVRE